MARTARASVGGICYHVINRGNAGMRVLQTEADYRAFMKLIGEACERVAMRVWGLCLMPTHFHFGLWPVNDGDLSRWMQWLLTAHVRRYHRVHKSHGHVWQGRFKAFPIQDDAHFLTVLRYIERNPLRAGLVSRAEEWTWSSLRAWGSQQGQASLHAGPMPRPENWLEFVNQPQSEQELKALRRSVNRGTPWGDDEWVARTAKRLGLESSLRPLGRPRKNR